MTKQLSYSINEHTNELELYVDDMLDRTYSDVHTDKVAIRLFKEWEQELIQREVLK